MYTDLKPIDKSKIKKVDFPAAQYLQEIYPKTQIVLHHTVSGPGAEGDIGTWKSDPARVATCIVLDRDGTPEQLFSSKYWAYHLKCGNPLRDKTSIGIEVDNWGFVTPQPNGKYRTYYGHDVDIEVQHYPGGFRGYEYYEKYTEAQIRTIGELLLLWHQVYSIPLDYHEDMWDVSQKALSGVPGVWSHVSYRKPSDKTDCHPQPNLIEMLKTLATL